MATDFGALLKKLLDTTGRTQKQIAKKIAEKTGSTINVEEANISRYVTGRNLPRYEETVYRQIEALFTVLITEHVITSDDQANELVSKVPFKYETDRAKTLRSKLEHEVLNILKRQQALEKPKDETTQGVSVFEEDNDIQIGILIRELHERLAASSTGLSARYDSIMAEIVINVIYMKLPPQEQSVFRRLAIFPYPYRCSIETTIEVCNVTAYSQAEFLEAREALRQRGLITVTDQQVQFWHPALHSFALKTLKETREEYETIKDRYIDYYYELFKDFIWNKYGYGSTTWDLEEDTLFFRFPQEKAHLKHAMEEMREKRQNYIRERLIAIYHDQDLYEETLSLLELPPETLTDEEKYLREYYEMLYENVTKEPDCPYKLVAWFWKYLEYELNLQYIHTSNEFADMWGRLALIYSCMDTDAILYKININKSLVWLN